MVVQPAGNICPSPEDVLKDVHALRQKLLAATHLEPDALAQSLPKGHVISILDSAFALLKAEPTLVEISVSNPDAKVIVVGDTHGQFHDVCGMLDLVGYPGPHRIYVFNGDYVDRGAWGLEVLLLLCALKKALPTCVYMLRGNHESSTCTRFYGFKGEVDAKYGRLGAKDVYQACKKLFSHLPLAALIQGNTLVLHGGLFRNPPPPVIKKGTKRRRRGAAAAAAALQFEAQAASVLEVGTVQALREAGKGGMDPDGLGSSVVAADVLWSDPVVEPGIQANEARGVGLIFGPDITQAFLEANGLRLVLRSHEGPDARDRRTDMPQVLQGYSTDHDTPAGKLMTIFSAPDYPQFQAAEERYNNKGAVAILSAPDYCQPELQSFEAVKPRPEARAYYDFEACADTDEEPGGSDAEDGPTASEGGLSTATTGATSSRQQDGGGESDADGGVSSAPAAAEAAQQQAMAAAAAAAATLGARTESELAEDGATAADGPSSGAGTAAAAATSAGESVEAGPAKQQGQPCELATGDVAEAQEAGAPTSSSASPRAHAMDVVGRGGGAGGAVFSSPGGHPEAKRQRTGADADAGQ